jgi:DNA adenine methylase
VRYFAGKSRLAPKIAKAILNHTPRRFEYFEPFVGGGAIVEHMSRHFVRTEARDVHRDLIMMWQALMAGWIPPEDVSFEEYKYWEKQPSSAMRGFVGFSCSFAGKWFGPYARFTKPDGRQQNFAEESKRNVQSCIDSLRNATFYRRSYTETPYTSKSVIYCDPPYAGTYSYSSFDTPKFWDWARAAVSAGAHVYVSEFRAPSDWKPLWSRDRAIMFGNRAKFARVTDTVYVHETQLILPVGKVSHHG